MSPFSFPWGLVSAFFVALSHYSTITWSSVCVRAHARAGAVYVQVWACLCIGVCVNVHACGHVCAWACACVNVHTHGHGCVGAFPAGPGAVCGPLCPPALCSLVLKLGTHEQCGQSSIWEESLTRVSRINIFFKDWFIYFRACA